jgi:hypothetical protein
VRITHCVQIMEIIKTGKLLRIEYENTDDVQTTSLFMGIYGVGKETTRSLSW